VTGIAVFGKGPLTREGGGLDMERVRAHVASRLHLLPHYRQKLAQTPIARDPIWIDDDRFDLRYHVRGAAVQQPGGAAQLKELTGRVTSQRLDPDRPLWELWFVEGLEDGRFAVIAKVHHCMVDGVTGVGLLTSLLSPAPVETVEPAPPWEPKPAPGMLGAVAEEASRVAELSLTAVRAAGEAVLSPLQVAGSVGRGAQLAWRTLQAGLTPPAETPLNRPIGSQRRVDWHALDLHDVRDARKRLGGSINDVVLCVVSGALRRLLKERRVRLRGLDLRVIVPVDTRSGPEDAAASNRVSAWFVSMPIGERDPLRRFARIRDQTRQMKESGVADGIDGLLRFADWAGATWISSWGASFVASLRPYNLIVTNIHGPDVPLYLLGAPLVEFYPQLPLFHGQGLAIAAMSYLGKIRFGLIGDWDVMPDLPKLPGALEASFAELLTSAQRAR
jgi:WS/DGAT/MGAT family acyltransferase